MNCGYFAAASDDEMRRPMPSLDPKLQLMEATHAIQFSVHKHGIFFNQLLLGGNLK